MPRRSATWAGPAKRSSGMSSRHAPPATLCSGASTWEPVWFDSVSTSTRQPCPGWSRSNSDRTGGWAGQFGLSWYTGWERSMNRMDDIRNVVDSQPIDATMPTGPTFILPGDSFMASKILAAVFAVAVLSVGGYTYWEYADGTPCCGTNA